MMIRLVEHDEYRIERQRLEGDGNKIDLSCSDINQGCMCYKSSLASNPGGGVLRPGLQMGQLCD